jgi:hypothetical protein
MKITIDLKELVTVVTNFNPDADLTGLKAYLFDYVVGEVGETKASPPARRLAPPSPLADVATKKYTEAQHEPEVMDDYAAENARLIAQAKAMKAEDTFADADEGPDAEPPPIARKLSPVEKKQQREAKRKDKDYSSMSSKEVIESLVSRTLAQKKSGSNQFVDIGGSDSDAGGGDIELG